tara:strand:+ start:1352 stop:2308 length:957 start_codon:yes stop_codon:yes gene_type:complete
MTKICFYGLLHIKPGENNKLNFHSKNHIEKIVVYLKNAVLLNEQLKNINIKFVLLTNKKVFIEKILKNLNYNLNIKTLSFKTFVPKNTHFYACHFRVDVFHYLSKLKNNYSILIDLDVLILKDLKNFKKNLNFNEGIVNNISNNVFPAYGKDVIKQKLIILDQNAKRFQWYGGDFFAGNFKFFKVMYQFSRYYQKKFVENMKNLRNQTDELFISATINKIKSDNLYKIKNSTNNRLFTRYWNTNVKHRQNNLSNYLSYKILHLPADKVFLSTCFNNLNETKNFKVNYKIYVESFKSFVKLSVSKYMPQLLKDYAKKVT